MVGVEAFDSLVGLEVLEGEATQFLVAPVVVEGYCVFLIKVELSSLLQVVVAWPWLEY